MLLAAGTQGFDFGSGEVWALHTAWSGNHRSVAERNPNGQSVLAGGELLLPGEITPQRRRVLHHPVGLRRPTGRPGRDVRPLPQVPARPTRTPAHPAAGHPEHLGVGVFRPRPRPG